MNDPDDAWCLLFLDTDEARTIDEVLGLTKHRHRGRWPTLYPAQVKQFDWLRNLMLSESYVRKGGRVRRYRIGARCFRCAVEVELRGALRSILFLLRHRRHFTRFDLLS